LCVGAAAISCNGNSFPNEKRSKSSHFSFNNSTDTNESFPHQKRTNDLLAVKDILLSNLGAQSFEIKFANPLGSN
jgi:hypothetical protein